MHVKFHLTGTIAQEMKMSQGYWWAMVLGWSCCSLSFSSIEFGFQSDSLVHTRRSPTKSNQIQCELYRPERNYCINLGGCLHKNCSIRLLTCNVGPSRSPTTLTSALAESSTTSGGNSSDHRMFSSSEKSAITIYFLTTSQFNPVTGVSLLYWESQSINVFNL
jgi:hypothetical protein